MDKETLSNYGWIVICVLVLAVMIALATPFGEYIKDAVWSTTKGLFDTGENALNTVGISSEAEKIKTGTVSGSYIVLNDVSSKTHDLKITLSSDTITDFSSVNVTRYNSNLTDLSLLTNDVLTANNDGTYTFTAVGGGASSCDTKNFAIKLSAGVPIVFSGKIVNRSNDKLVVCARTTFKDGTKEDVVICSADKQSSTHTFDKDITAMKFFIRRNDVGYSGTGDWLITENIKMNVGEEQPYENYLNLVRVTASADGTVTGLTSVSPNMTLVCDTEGVTINCEYQRQRLPYDLEGKTIVNFGDSIFGNYVAPVDISTMIANKTGATVYNVGFGGAQMSETSNVRYNAFGMENLADAITTGDFSLQEKHYTKEDRFVAPFNTLKSIDFNSVDIITIAYGTNDFAKSKSLDDVKNATKYSIETIKNKYPNIDIVLCTPVYRFWMDDNGDFVEDSNTKEINGVKLTDYIQLYKEIGKEYGLTVIDNYNGSGITKNNIAECFPSDDGVHPSETGRQMIAENMAKELYKYFG